ncbi:MAG: alpha/beta hydrolase [Erysipelotrichaceae bacterium]|nr:alpha/beta hydrolase [Erysipelotrichaceae bacterium]MBQ6492342.1 alpha/beta hydrolase [Erysipelotrichaceae bacterium]
MTTEIKKKIPVNGIMQKIHVVSKDPTLPVLLFLHGGPGVVNRHSIFASHSDLLDSFTLATWDQRGTGGSYAGVDTNTLTISQLVDDAREVVQYLCDEFNKDKIFIIGGSWGSLLGIRLAYAYPEHIAAFVGFGQFVNGEKNEEISYQYTLSEAKAAKDEEAVKTLESVGPPVAGVYKGGFDGMMKQRRLMMKYGGYSKAEEKRSYLDSFVKPMLLSGEYSLSDLAGILLGYKKVLKAMWPEIGAEDLTRYISFAVPIFVFDGRLDMNTPAELVEDWFAKIKAPEKELIWFDNSGHNPMGDEPERFKKLLKEKLKKYSV